MTLLPSMSKFNFQKDLANKCFKGVVERIRKKKFYLKNTS